MMKLEIYPVLCIHPPHPQTCSIQIPSFFPELKSQSNLLCALF